MQTVEFAEIVGDLEDFFDSHFDAQPLLRKDAVQSPSDRILSLEAVERILATSPLRSPYIGVAKGGIPMAPATYTSSIFVQGTAIPDAVDPSLVLGHFRDGATITLHAVNQYVSQLETLAFEMQKIFSTSSESMAFLTPPGQTGFKPHSDNTDVYVVQLEGTKKWSVWETPKNRQDMPGHFRLEELGEPLIETVLEPGDTLYLPHGTPHVASALDKVSLHISATVKTRTWGEIAASYLRKLMNEVADFQDVPVISRMDAGSIATEFERRWVALDQLVEAKGPFSAELIGGEFKSLLGASSSVSHLRSMAEAEMLSSDTMLWPVRSSNLRLNNSKDGTSDVIINGKSFRLPGAIAKAIELAFHNDSTKASQILPNSAGASLGLAKQLVLRGLFTIQDGTHPAV